MQRQIVIDAYLHHVQTYERTQAFTEAEILAEAITKEKLLGVFRKQTDFVNKTLKKYRVKLGPIKTKAIKATAGTPTVFTS